MYRQRKQFLFDKYNLAHTVYNVDCMQNVYFNYYLIDNTIATVGVY